MTNVVWQFNNGNGLGWHDCLPFVSSSLETLFSTSSASESTVLMHSADMVRMRWGVCAIRRSDSSLADTRACFWDGNDWHEFDPSDQCTINAAVMAGRDKLTLFVEDEEYRVDLRNMHQINVRTKTRRAIRLANDPQPHSQVADYEDNDSGEDDDADSNVANETPEFICPITQQLFKNPVVAADGHSYELSAIRKWLTTHSTSPLTGRKLISKALVPNRTLRALVRDAKSGATRSTARRLVPTSPSYSPCM